MRPEYILVSFDKISFSLKPKSSLIKKSKFIKFPDALLCFEKKVTKTPKGNNYNLFTLYEDKRGRKIMVFYSPSRLYLPWLRVIFCPTIKSNFSFKLIKRIVKALGFEIKHFLLSKLEIAFDFYDAELSEIRSRFWSSSRNNFYLDSKRVCEKTPMNLKPNHTVYQGSQKTQTYRLIRIYEKEEFGETCIRCELVLGKRLLRRYEVDSFDDLFKWEFQNKFFNSFGWFDFDRRKFERKHGMVEWLKIFLGKYDLKFVYQQLKIETGDLPNFKALYLEPLRVNIIARHRFNEYLKSFLGWKKF